jgi:hypothetical protein
MTCRISMTLMRTQFRFNLSFLYIFTHMHKQTNGTSTRTRTVTTASRGKTFSWPRLVPHPLHLQSTPDPPHAGAAFEPHIHLRAHTILRCEHARAHANTNITQSYGKFSPKGIKIGCSTAHAVESVVVWPFAKKSRATGSRLCLHANLPAVIQPLP